MRRAAPALVCLASCVTHATVSRDALRFPVAVEDDAPTVLAAVDDDGDPTSFEIRPDTRVRLRLEDGSVEARARDIVLAQDAIVVERDGGERSIPWERVRGADVSATRPWLAFAIVVGASVAVGGVVLLAESDL